MIFLRKIQLILDALYKIAPAIYEFWTKIRKWRAK